MRHARLCLVILMLGALWGCAKQTEVPYGSETPAIAPGKPAPTLEKVRAELATVKSQLAESGKYACCMKSPCNLCALNHGNCPCQAELKGGEGVCGECYAGWKAGRGNVEGVDPKKVTLGAGHDPSEGGTGKQ